MIKLKDLLEDIGTTDKDILKALNMQYANKIEKVPGPSKARFELRWKQAGNDILAKQKVVKDMKI